MLFQSSASTSSSLSGEESGAPAWPSIVLCPWPIGLASPTIFDLGRGDPCFFSAIFFFFPSKTLPRIAKTLPCGQNGLAIFFRAPQIFFRAQKRLAPRARPIGRGQRFVPKRVNLLVSSSLSASCSLVSFLASCASPAARPHGAWRRRRTIGASRSSMPSRSFGKLARSSPQPSHT